MRYLAMARKVAAKSTHRSHAHGAVVVRGGAVLASAANTGRWGHCAERRALHRNRYRGATVYTARSNGRYSQPCAACMTALREAGIRVVVFVDQNGAIAELTL